MKNIMIISVGVQTWFQNRNYIASLEQIVKIRITVRHVESHWCSYIEVEMVPEEDLKFLDERKSVVCKYSNNMETF